MKLGVLTSSIKRTPSFTSLNELILGQPYLNESGHSYLFRLTGENFVDVLYGICIVKNEIVEVINFSIFEKIFYFIYRNLQVLLIFLMN